jgi:hypothetical protein
LWSGAAGMEDNAMGCAGEGKEEVRRVLVGWAACPVSGGCAVLFWLAPRGGDE